MQVVRTDRRVYLVNCQKIVKKMSSADTWAASQFYNLSQAARPKMLRFRAFSSRTAVGIHLTHLLSLLILQKNILCI